MGNSRHFCLSFINYTLCGKYYLKRDITISTIHAYISTIPKIGSGTYVHTCSIQILSTPGVNLCSIRFISFQCVEAVMNGASFEYILHPI